jgi:hypothetical protein
MAFVSFDVATNDLTFVSQSLLVNVENILQLSLYISRLHTHLPLRHGTVRKKFMLNMKKWDLWLLPVVYRALGDTFQKALLILFRPNIQNFIQNTPTSSRKTPFFNFFHFQASKFIILTSKTPSSTSDRFHPFQLNLTILF